MSSLTVFDFNSQQVRVVSINNEPWFVAKDVCDILEIRNVSNALTRLEEDEKNTIVLNDSITAGNPNTSIISESGMYALVLSSRKPEARPFRKWVTSEVLPQIRKTGSYAIQDITVTFKSKVPLSEIEEYLNLCEGTFGKAYRQRLLPICLKKFHPHLPVIDAEPAEKASLPTKALLNPTQIASVLGFYYKTGSPNPQKVNKLLEELGYQVNIAGRWSATEKADGLCDRKPVETNSKTQKDQLLWVDNIIDILKSEVDF